MVGDVLYLDHWNIRSAVRTHWSFRLGGIPIPGILAFAVLSMVVPRYLNLHSWTRCICPSVFTPGHSFRRIFEVRKESCRGYLFCRCFFTHHLSTIPNPGNYRLSFRGNSGRWIEYFFKIDTLETSRNNARCYRGGICLNTRLVLLRESKCNTSYQ